MCRPVHNRFTDRFSALCPTRAGLSFPNATITVTDEAKGTVVTVTSNASGDYSVPHLIPDVYDLKVVAKGFKTFETKGITV